MTEQAEVKKRSWIFEALMMMLEKKTYGKITMGDIAKKTGVSRQTLYFLFKNKDDIISQFLMKTAGAGLLSIERENQKDAILIAFNNEFVIKHYGILLKLLTDDYINNLIIHLTREKVFGIAECYKPLLPALEYDMCLYKLGYQTSGCLTVLTDWLKNGMPQPVDALLAMLNNMTKPEKKSKRHLPYIEVRAW